MSAPYRKAHGHMLTLAEAAQLLTRAAQGERLSFVPVRTPTGFELAHVATLTPTQHEDHARRVRAVAAALATFAAPALSA